MFDSPHITVSKHVLNYTSKNSANKTQNVQRYKVTANKGMFEQKHHNCNDDICEYIWPGPYCLFTTFGRGRTTVCSQTKSSVNLLTCLQCCI